MQQKSPSFYHDECLPSQNVTQIVLSCSIFSKEIEKCLDEPERLGLIFSRYVSNHLGTV